MTELYKFMAAALLLIAALYGYVLNAVALYRLCCELSGELVLRAIGVALLPLGVVLGYVL